MATCWLRVRSLQADAARQRADSSGGAHLMNGPREIGTVLVGLPADASDDALSGRGRWRTLAPWPGRTWPGCSARGPAVASATSPALAARVRAVGREDGRPRPSRALANRSGASLDVAIDDATHICRATVGRAALSRPSPRSGPRQPGGGHHRRRRAAPGDPGNPVARRLLSLPSDENGQAADADSGRARPVRRGGRIRRRRRAAFESARHPQLLGAGPRR